MSNSHRRHEAAGKSSRRGPKNKQSDDDLKPLLKSHKQRRPKVRRKLRREYT